MIARKNKVVRKLVAGVESTMKANKVTVVKGDAMIEGRSTDGIEVSCNGENIGVKTCLSVPDPKPPYLPFPD